MTIADRPAVLAAMLGHPAEIIADYQRIHNQSAFTSQYDDIFEMIRRRSCSVSDIALTSGLHKNEIIKYLEELSTQGKIVSEIQGTTFYYKACTWLENQTDRKR